MSAPTPWGMIGGYRKRKLQEWKGSDLASLRRSVVQRSRQAESPTEVREVYGRLRGSIRRVIVGKDRVVDLCLISLLAGGHVLLTDIPGVGKTTLARAIASSVAAEFSR